MANIAPGLNFRIGADVKGINKAIREAEKSLRGAVQSFSNIGNSLSLALSAPLVAFGAMAVKTAGQMENLRFALEGTMKDAGRSTADAAKELEALRVAALAPGLDFEQAVRGSVRLQSVGIQAEKAREIIVQLANALALSGGTADQLDGVTKQFTQMIGKGKILQEDISIILENMPALASVMKKEFGQTTAEGLNKAGVSVEQFIQRLTTGMQDLPRATGGISNAITNAVSAVQQALASVGEEINKTFNVSGALNEFSQWVASLASWFKNLDEGTKRAIAAVAVFAVTLGPAFKLMQGGVWIVGQLHVAFLGLQKVLAQSMAGQAIPSLIAKWKALDVVMKTSVIGATVAVVLALAAAFVVLQKDMSASAQAAQAMEGINKSAADAASEARAKTQYLVEVIKDENAGYKEKQGALKKLNEIAPEYFNGLSIEKSSIDDLNKAYDSYIDSILRAARAKAAEEKLIELDKEAIALAEKKNRLSVESIAGSKYETMGFNAMAGAQKTAADTKAELIARTDEEIAANKATMETLKGLIKENTVLVAATKTVAKAVVSATKESKLYTEVLSDIANVSAQQDLLGSEKIVEQAKAIEGGIKRLLDGGFRPASAEVQGLKKQLQGLFSGVSMGNFAQLPTLQTPNTIGVANELSKTAEMFTVVTSSAMNYNAVTEKMVEIQTAMQQPMADTSNLLGELSNQFIAHGEILAGIAMGLVGAMESVASAGGGFEELAGGILGSLKKIIGGLIKAGVAAVVQGALIKNALLGVWAVPLGIAAGSLAQIAFNSILNKIRPPELAEGGVLTGPQLVMAGEYAGASHNPEIVTPENKMRDVFSEVMRASGGAGGGALSVRVSGDDLLFVLEKAQTRNGRKR